MKSMFYLVASLAIAYGAYTAPITSFPEGSYLGMGTYITLDGTGDSFASYASITANAWQITQYRDGGIYVYDYNFTIDNYGFFSVEVVDNSDPSNPLTYNGNGYCESVQCHMEVDLNDNNTIEQTVTFHPGGTNIYVLGSIRPSDAGSNEQPFVSWEETMVIVESACSGDK
jgi:hypothetical protein